MYFSALFLAVLPFLVSAAPFNESSRDGVSIPIAKRSGFLDVDGVVDTVKLQVGLQRTFAKIQRGFEAFERNTGAAHPSASQMERSVKRGKGEPLDHFSATFWYGTIAVGTPPVIYTVVFDTGSSEFLLPSSDCRSTCTGHKLYDFSSSSTSRDVGQAFVLKYADGSIVAGEQYTDTVSLAGYKASLQRLSAAAIYFGFQSDEFPADGLLGMAYESLSIFGASPLFQSLVSQGRVSNPVFSFYFANSGSELYIGGTNRKLYKGNFSYMPVTTQGYWQGSFGNISVNGKTVIQSKDVVIDTGTTQVIGDTKSVQAIYDRIPGSKHDVSSGVGYWTIPCDFNTSVSITFSGKKFPISPSTFNLGLESSGSEVCVGGIGAIDGLDFWVIGDVFLQNVYTVFDLGKNRVGFASLA